MKFVSETIPLEHIRLSTGYNLHPWDLVRKDDALTKSFNETGILHPPIVMDDDAGTFILISGYKRLSFLYSANVTSTLCHLLPADCSADLLLRLILADQQQNGAITPVEKARFFQIALRLLPNEEIGKKISVLLSQPVQPDTIAKTVSMVDQPIPFIEAVHSGFVDEKMAFELVDLPCSADRMAILDLFVMLRMGGGKQKKLLSQMKEMAKRNEISLSALLNQPDLKKIIYDEAMNAPQKVQHLIDLMAKMLNPRLTAKQQSFHERVKNLKLPSTWEVSHSESFERDAVTLTIEYENIDELEKNLAKSSLLFLSRQNHGAKAV